MATMYIGARDDASHLSHRLSLSPLPPSLLSFSLFLAFSLPLTRGTRRWVCVPPFCARIVTPSTSGPPPRTFTPCPSRGAVLQCLATPGIVTGIVIIIATVAAEWRMEKQRAGGASCYVECRIRGKLHSPSPPLLLPRIRLS